MIIGSRRVGIVSWLAALVLVGAAAAPAEAAFGVSAFDTQSTGNALGEPYTQAGGHPFAASASVEFNAAELPNGLFQIEGGTAKDIDVSLPPGLVGNPTVTPKCTEPQLQSGTASSLSCPLDTQVGFFEVGTASKGGPVKGAGVYNMVPTPGEPALFAFNLENVTVPHIIPRLVPERNYAIDLDTEGISQTEPLRSVTVSLWGVPAAASHDPQRGLGCGGSIGEIIETIAECEAQASLHRGNKPSSLTPTALLILPADCGAGPLATRLRTDPWLDPGAWVEKLSVSHLPPSYPAPEAEWGAPQGVTGCNRLYFAPKLEAKPETTSSDSPSGFDVDLAFPQSDNPTGLQTPPLRDAAITLPEGMTINPSAADGLGACEDSQANPRSSAPFACPSSSKIGSVTATTPLLEESISGGIYLGTQKSSDPQSGQMFRLFLRLVNAERGIDIRLPGEVRVNSASGQLEASFRGNPQFPVSTISVNLKQGPRAPLATPQSCGTKTTTAHLTSWAGQAVDLTDSFDVPCPAAGSFAPKFEAGTVNPFAGKASPFRFHLGREDGQQSLSGLTMSLPKGLTAYLKGVPYCSDAALAAASGRSGNAELASPSCSSASQVGDVRVGAGAGTPYYVTGRAYLAGPYKGAPLSMAVITPAVAGPFDLGTVVVRAALRVDPVTAEITAVSDPLPQILEGVPLRLRSVEVNVDRPQFTLNPTSCEPMAIDSTITGSAGAQAHPSSRFQVGSCERLAFKPSLKLSVKGGTKRGAYQKLRAELRAKPGEAGIGKVSVALPHSEFLAQEHIKTICTRVQYAAKSCPKGSVYGYARAFSPLLDQPLQGPVYLRSSSHPLPDLVVSLDGQIHIDLVGRIDSVRGGIRNSFETLPDAPVSKFVLTMKGGKKSLLVNSRDLCRSSNRATVRMDGQNGKANDFRPLLRSRCGKKGHRGGRHARK